MTHRTRHVLVGYGFLLPAVLMLAVFFLYPLVNVFWMSLHKWPIFGNPTWVGLRNFGIVFDDPNFWQAMRFTIVYTLTVTPLLFILAFVSAVICNARMPGTTFFRSMYFLPVVMSFATASFVWLWLYSELYGVITYVMRWLDGDLDRQLNVFATGPSAMWAVNFMVTWKFAGIQMIILLAGMQAIRDDYYEASTLMGASRWQTTWHVTLPLLKSSLALALIMSIAGSIQAFEQFAIMTDGGPANQTRTIMMLTIDTAFDYFKLGPASAISMCIMALLIVLTMIQLRIFRKDH
ncbi:MAG: sugar ABC transporter permease [Hyphomicrobiales bacterium]|nr:sugar ABC transporter permease [Hyphomicrobiales bacterium]